MSKVDLDEIYNPSHKLKSNIYKAIQQQSLDNKKNKLFKKDILNFVKEKKDEEDSENSFEMDQDKIESKMKEDGNTKLIRMLFDMFE